MADQIGMFDKQEVLADFHLAQLSRQIALLARKEVIIFSPFLNEREELLDIIDNRSRKIS